MINRNSLEREGGLQDLPLCFLKMNVMLVRLVNDQNTQGEI